MHVGVLTVLLGDQPLEDAVEYLDSIGVEAVEIACGGYVGDDHLPTDRYLDDDAAQAELLELLGEYDAIHHFHAKDTRVYEEQARTRGVLDTQPYADVADRSWSFRSVGYGHGESHWKDVVSTLQMVGYDGVLSIEHEDPLASPTEGLEKAVDVLQRAAFEETPGDAYWA